MPRFEQMLFGGMVVGLFIYFVAIGMYRDYKDIQSQYKKKDDK